MRQIKRYTTKDLVVKMKLQQEDTFNIGFDLVDGVPGSIISLTYDETISLVNKLQEFLENVTPIIEEN